MILQRLYLSCTLVAALSGSAIAGPVTDGEFTSWTTTATAARGISGGVGGTATGTLVATGGNPGARYLVDINETGFQIGSANLKTDYVNTAALAGNSWTMSVDALNGPAGQHFQGASLLVKQGSSEWSYVNSFVVNNADSAWHTYTLNGTFTPNQFVLLEGSPASPSVPTFTAGTSTQFGLYNYLQQGGGHYEEYYDNWSLASTNLDSSTPEPGSMAMLSAIGLVGSSLFARRRRLEKRA